MPGLFCPAFADVFVWGEAFEDLEPFGEVVGGHEICEVFAQLVIGLIVEALDRCLLERPVHPLDLSVGPGMLWLGCPVIDVVPGAGVLEGVRPEAFATGHGLFDQRHRRSAAARRGELDAIVGQRGVDLVRDGFDQPEQEIARGCRLGVFVQFNECELAGSVDRHEHVELALLGANLGHVDVEVSNGV